MSEDDSQKKAKKKPTVKELMALPKDQFVAFLGPVYEHSPWVAERLAAERGVLETVSDLAGAMRSIVDGSSSDEKLALLRAHPDLCERASKLRELTPESRAEQGRAGLQALTDQEMDAFRADSARYRETYQFPFILAVRNATKHTVLAALKGRVDRKGTYESELSVALEQVHKIAWMRLLEAIDLSTCRGFLTCHVLDTANGCPGTRKRNRIPCPSLTRAPRSPARSLARSHFVLLVLFPPPALPLRRTHPPSPAGESKNG
jgi:OHCU decarboxylase